MKNRLAPRPCSRANSTSTPVRCFSGIVSQEDVDREERHREPRHRQPSAREERRQEREENEHRVRQPEPPGDRNRYGHREDERQNVQHLFALSRGEPFVGSPPRSLQPYPQGGITPRPVRVRAIQQEAEKGRERNGKVSPQVPWQICLRVQPVEPWSQRGEWTGARQRNRHQRGREDDAVRSGETDDRAPQCGRNKLISSEVVEGGRPVR